MQQPVSLTGAAELSCRNCTGTVCTEYSFLNIYFTTCEFTVRYDEFFVKIEYIYLKFVKVINAVMSLSALTT